MRKITLLQRMLKILGVSALTIFILTCSDEFKVREQEGKAAVSFTVTGNSARTIFPQISLEDVAWYELLGGRNGDTETILVDSFTGTETTIHLDPGTWNFTLNAYNFLDKQILQGKAQDQQINLTGTNQVSFSLSTVNSGTGSIVITLNFPESAEITNIDVTISVNDNVVYTENNISGADSFVYTKEDVESGDYDIFFKLYTGNKLRAVIPERVKVHGNLTSIGTITLVEEDLKQVIPYFEIITILELNEWELTDQFVQTNPNEDKLFTVKGTYETYQWYLDGTPVENSSSYIFNKSAGIYQLVVVVKNSNGENRSGRCRITVTQAVTPTPAVYTVTFDINSGTGTTPTAQSVNAGSGIILSSGYGLEKSGYVFAGWNTNYAGTGNNYNAGSSYTPTENITLHARWIQTYTVTFDRTSGTGTVPTSQTVSNRTSITLPSGSGLTNSGYMFVGWNTNYAGTGATYVAGSSYLVTGNITLYAKWGALSYTVTFRENGGTGTAPTAQTVNPGNSITMPDGSAITRDGYAFDGWNTNPDGTGDNYNAGSSYIPAASIIFYAKWNVTRYTVNFSANGGTGTPPTAQTVVVGSSINIPGSNGLTMNGYTFDGWTAATGTNYNAGVQYTPSGNIANITLYANWNQDYTITFMYNGANSGGLSETRTVPVGTSISFPSDYFSRTGYLFGGWNTARDGTGTNYNAGSSYTPTGSVKNITFYAKWNPAYTVTFNANSGTGTPPTAQSVLVGSSVTLPGSNGLTRSGYVFGGWNTNNAGTGTNYDVGSSYTPTADIILYVKWNITPGSETNPIPLTIDTWLDDSITSTTYQNAVWYSFPVTAGVEYLVWWNDRFAGDLTKTLDVKVSAYYSNNTSTAIFSDEDAGNKGIYFIATRTDTVKVKVVPFSSGNTGTFAVRYTSYNNDGSEENPFKLIAGMWLDGATTSATDTLWYKFSVTSGTYYNIWWNSYFDGPTPKNKTLDTLVSFYYEDGTNIGVSLNVGWTNPKTFYATQDSSVKIKMTGITSSSTGTFALTYNTGIITRP